MANDRRYTDTLLQKLRSLSVAIRGTISVCMQERTCALGCLSPLAIKEGGNEVQGVVKWVAGMSTAHVCGVLRTYIHIHTRIHT